MIFVASLLSVLVFPLSHTDTLGYPEQNIESVTLKEISEKKDFVDNLRLRRETESGDDIWRNIFSDIRGYVLFFVVLKIPKNLFR